MPLASTGVPMATAAQPWHLSGQYFETCSCDFVCPCVTSNLVAVPSKGSCTYAMAFQVDDGRYGGVVLDGLRFVIVGRTPGAMVAGGWSVGLIVDDRASPEQQEALLTIASGQAGGPLANLAPLVSEFLGVERAPIEIAQDGLRWSVSSPGRLDQAAEGVAGADRDQPLAIDNTLHPANTRLALARAQRSHLDAFGLRWDDDSGGNNGHFAPFSWRVG